MASNDDCGRRFDSQLQLHGPGRGHVLRGRRGVQRAAGRPVRPGQRRRRRQRGPVHGDHHRGRGRPGLLRGQARGRRRARRLGEGLAGVPDRLRHRPARGARLRPGRVASSTRWLAAARRRQRGHRLRGDQGRLALRRRGGAAPARYDITVEAYRPALQGDHAGPDAVPGLRRRPGSTPAIFGGTGQRDAEPVRGVPRQVGHHPRRGGRGDRRGRRRGHREPQAGPDRQRPQQPGSS